ncbi:penicillin-binding protein 2 [Shimia marina]|uniref:Sporulation-specific penicillin-binding protein n=1 Tax=Shimia marina TaxID=321267 RepID=A0A0N7LSR5_9RHOB|nr:penicillin-binding protein 2 [Shimia marina]CUH54356.1 Sporulation-specific penicillin-binding protein [Shimia marina]SFE01480.1 peptidoglycan glycosyltransferase [Shimia marina]
MRKTPTEITEVHSRMSRRTLFLGGSMLAFMTGLGFRMRHLQLDQADQYRLLAEENRINIRLIPPARGEIFDRNGIVLARNEPSYRITLVPEDAGDVDKVIEKLATLVELDPNELDRAVTEMRRSPPFLPVTIADRVSWDELSRVAVNTPALPGITPEVGLSRYYPLRGDLAHVLGYVGPVSDYDLSKIDNPDQLLRIPRFQIGKVGLEGRMEDDLRGVAGTKRVEVNAVGRVMRELDRREGQQGDDVQLTIDQQLQSYAQARLGDESAAAVVMDCVTGDLLAVASAPSFDPNLFVQGISVTDYGTLTSDNHRPLAAKSVQGAYPPGSTFKMITALAALEAGIVGYGGTVYCPGHMKVSNRRFHCWKRGGHGHMDLAGALRESCDVYFYDLAIQVGIDKISEVATKLGLGQRYDLPLSGVARGLNPNRAWKADVRGADWVVGDTANASIGQGFVLASPLQLAVMTARLASGKALDPRIVKSVNGVEETLPVVPNLELNAAHLAEVQRGMFQVSNHRRGTAYSQRIIDDEFRMAGKTGTSQVRNITAAERARGVTRNEDLPWERRDHGLFVNYAPYDNPRIAVAVVVEHGGGSKSATPIGRDITLQALYGGTPPLSAYPAKDREKIKKQQEEMQKLVPGREITRRNRA